MTPVSVVREEFSKIVAPLFRADLSSETLAISSQKNLDEVLNMCKCGHFTVYQTFDLILVYYAASAGFCLSHADSSPHALLSGGYVVAIWLTPLHCVHLTFSDPQMELGCDVIPTS